MKAELTLENLQQVRSICKVAERPFNEDESTMYYIQLYVEDGRPIWLTNVPYSSLWIMRNFIQAITGFIFKKDGGDWVRSDEKLPIVVASETHQPLTLGNLQQVHELHDSSSEEKGFALFLRLEKGGRLALNSTSTATADNPERRLFYETEYSWVLTLIRHITGKEFKMKYAHDPYNCIWQAQEAE